MTKTKKEIEDSLESIFKETDEIGKMLEAKMGKKRFNEILDKRSKDLGL
jgi:hypothetical protein